MHFKLKTLPFNKMLSWLSVYTSKSVWNRKHAKLKNLTEIQSLVKFGFINSNYFASVKSCKLLITNTMLFSEFGRCFVASFSEFAKKS